MPPATLFRYIGGRMIVSIMALFLILAAFVLVADLIENLRFISKFDKGDFGAALQLTLLRAPALTQTLAPFVFLFGSIWMFSQLNRRAEIAVMRAAGLSVWRLIGPAALVAALGQEARPASLDYFVCGSPTLVGTAFRAMDALGVPADHVRTEQFDLV